MPSVRRSARSKKPVNPLLDWGYPDGPPSTDLEKCISKLNQESFPTDKYARIDDILTFALFASKRTPGWYRALVPTRVFFDEDAPISLDIAMDICTMYTPLATGSPDSSLVAQQATDLIKMKYPWILQDSVDEKVSKHLLTRYHVMHHRPESAISIEKVQFHVAGAGKITCGLKATRPISAATAILAACSSMSSDLVHDRPAVSVINSSSHQKGRLGPRLILGPFRFANHDCKPNCQIMAIPGSHAYTLCTIHMVQAGEPLTVNYATDGSYFEGRTCGCATCNPEEPPIAKRRPIDHSRFPENPHKKTRRGGKRARRRLKQPALTSPE